MTLNRFGGRRKFDRRLFIVELTHGCLAFLVEVVFDLLVYLHMLAKQIATCVIIASYVRFNDSPQKSISVLTCTSGYASLSAAMFDMIVSL